MKKSYLFLFLMTLLPVTAIANLDLITWKGIFYKGAPLKKEVNQEYCQAHTPGIVVHTTKQTRNGSVITDKGIKLDHITLTIDKVDNLFLLHGELDAKTKQWQDHIFYYTYKLSEGGDTKGIWYSDKCKGVYVGIPVRNNNG